MRSREWLDERRMLNDLVRESREIGAMLNSVGTAPELPIDNDG
jgi:hypothetical protein